MAQIITPVVQGTRAQRQSDALAAYQTAKVDQVPQPSTFDMVECGGLTISPQSAAPQDEEQRAPRVSRAFLRPSSQAWSLNQMPTLWGVI